MEPKEACIIGQIDESRLTAREAVGVKLAEKIAADPNEIDDEFFTEVHQHFTDEEIVEMVFACSIFNWGNKFNITMRLDTSPESAYPTDMAYPYTSG